MKMNFFILGFQRRVWCPKWTPASRSSFIPISANATSGLDPPLLPPEGPPRRETGHPVRSVSDGGVPKPVRLMRASDLPLRELEPLAGRGLSVLLPFLHACVAGQKPFLPEKSAKRGIDAEQGPRRAQRDRARLTRQPAAADARREIVLVRVVARHEWLQGDPAQSEPAEILVEVPSIDGALARAQRETNPRDRGLSAARPQEISHRFESPP